jgi:hypothetical protein
MIEDCVIDVQYKAFSAHPSSDLFETCLHSLRPAKLSEMVPVTFLVDGEHLIRLRADMLDIINLRSACFLYHSLVATSRPEPSCTARDKTPITYFLLSLYNWYISLIDNTMLLFLKQNLLQARGCYRG